MANREFYNCLIEEKRNLEKLLKELEERLKTAPQGRLRVMKARGKYNQYYVYYEEEASERPNGHYIRREKNDLALALAQKDYDEVVLREVNKKLNAIERAVKCYGPEMTGMKAYENMQENRRNLVVPVELTDEEFIKNWYKSKKTGENSYASSGNMPKEQQKRLIYMRGTGIGSGEIFYTPLKRQEECRTTEILTIL